MIDGENILLDTNVCVGTWCTGGGDATDLARVAENVIAQKIPIVSMLPENVATVWPWLENRGVKIYARLYLGADVADITQKINTVFKRGADGVQLFVRFSDLADFVSQMHLIRDDLFFNKDLLIGIDIDEIGPFDWPVLFGLLKKIRADGLILALTHDNGDDSDFVGRVYAMLGVIENNFDGMIHFATGLTTSRIDQVARLVHLIAPDYLSRTMFFISSVGRG